MSSFENGSNSDPEKNVKGTGEVQGESPERAEWDPAPREPWTRRFIDSFKRDPNAAITNESQRKVAHGEFDHKAAAERTANSGLAHKLKARHMQMIAIGGSIGELVPRKRSGVSNICQVPVCSSPLAQLFRLVDPHHWSLLSSSLVSSCSVLSKPWASLPFSFRLLDLSRLIRRDSWILHGGLLWDGSTCIQLVNRRGKLNF
jgi:hypothetical protein